MKVPRRFSSANLLVTRYPIVRLSSVLQPAPEFICELTQESRYGRQRSGQEQQGMVADDLILTALLMSSIAFRGSEAF